MNNNELKQKVQAIAENLLKEKNYISPVDLLMRSNILVDKDYEDWRHGRVPYLERVCRINLSKLSLLMKELMIYAKQNNLKPSLTVYHQWGVKGKKIPLRFSKSGVQNIEKAYATHYVVSDKR